MAGIVQIRREVHATKAELVSAQAAKYATGAVLASLPSSLAEVSTKLVNLVFTRA